MKRIFFLLLLLPLLWSCSVCVPTDFRAVNDTVSIYPDYREVTIPYNMAPLTFQVEMVADDYVTVISNEASASLTYGGKEIKPSLKDWRHLVEESRDKALTVQIYTKDNGTWEQHPPFYIHVAKEPIDEYLNYRLIQPAYFHYEDVVLCQRHLTDYEERDIYANSILKDRNHNQCINCHAFQNGKTDNMQFHVRGDDGGTVVVVDGKAKKVNLKKENTISSGVYPAWHPTLPLIAYSVNTTGQLFYTKDAQKVEVQDTYSGLVLYNPVTDTLMTIRDAEDELETFPTWSPDGKTLYYVSAYLPRNNQPREQQLPQMYDSVKYNIFKMSFDETSGTFGKPDTVFNAQALGMSATLPRISPDGKQLLFTMGEYGTFHIWHKSSNLWLMELHTGSVREAVELNSPDVESYHSWSSNGHWVVFSTRREDGSYTRPYFSYFQSDGTFTKPFPLPQKSPYFHRRFFYNYNIPEFTTEPVTLSPHDYASVIKGEAIPVK